MSRPVPLMFIKNPSISYNRLVDEGENDFSYVEDEENNEETQHEETINETNEVNVRVSRQLKKLQSPFGRHLYNPVRIKLINDQEISGTVEKVEEKQIFVVTDEEHSHPITIPTATITNILWQGKAIPEK